MADLDNDGQIDILSGSYWPGDMYWFRGLGGGKFAEPKILKNKSGANLNVSAVSETMERDSTAKSEHYETKYEGLAPTPVPVDFDGDGDLDLIVGNIYGRVLSVINEGDRANPVFGAVRQIVAGGKPIKLDGDAGPAVADWDQDGTWDLLVGSDDGSVNFYRNIGTASQPSFDERVILIPPVPTGDSNSFRAHNDVPERSQVRVKVSSADWNNDGLLDLIVGDVATAKLPLKLSTTEVERRDALRAAIESLRKKSQPLRDKPDSLRTAEEKAEYRAIGAEMSKYGRELDQLEEKLVTTGWIWVYLRKPSVNAGK